jgi:hypothetical protein
VPLVHRVFKVKLVPQAMTEPQVLQVSKVAQGYKDLLAQPVTWVIRVPLEQLEYKDLKAQQVFKVKLVPQVQVD